MVKLEALSQRTSRTCPRLPIESYHRKMIPSRMWTRANGPLSLRYLAEHQYHLGHPLTLLMKAKDRFAQLPRKSVLWSIGRNPKDKQAGEKLLVSEQPLLRVQMATFWDRLGQVLQKSPFFRQGHSLRDKPAGPRLLMTRRRIRNGMAEQNLLAVN